MYSRWRHPLKTVSPRPYCRSRRRRNGLGSETSSNLALPVQPANIILMTSYLPEGHRIFAVLHTKVDILYRICHYSTSQYVLKLNINHKH